MEPVDRPLTLALERLDRAIDRVERAVTLRVEHDRAEISRVNSALRAAQVEQAALADANSTAAERLDQTIGRLRGLLSF